ncbi:MAG: hypothetical protein V2A73_12980 [Pseudomonadota bacterium]
MRPVLASAEMLDGSASPNQFGHRATSLATCCAFVVFLMASQPAMASPDDGSVVPAQPTLPGTDLGATARFGLLGTASGATTRAVAWELSAGGRWWLLSNLGLALSYRGALRNAGSAAVGALHVVHRLQLGAFVDREWSKARICAEVGIHPRLETTSFHARDGDGFANTRIGVGIGADVSAGLRVARNLFAVVAFAAYQRATAFDLGLSVGIEWKWQPRRRPLLAR